MIIADQLNDDTMRNLAFSDYQLALKSQDSLVNELNKAIAPSGSGTDVNGNTLFPVKDGIAALPVKHHSYGCRNRHGTTVAQFVDA